MARTVYENSLFRLVQEGREIKGKVKLTPEVIAAVDAQLRRRPLNRRQLYIPTELLEQVGVTSTDQLEISVEHGKLVLTPKGTSSDEPATH